MKIRKIQILKGLGSLSFSVLLAVLFLANSHSYAQVDGGPLFDANCAKCHHPVDKSTGPALKDARSRWADAGEGAIYEWVRDNGALRAAGNAYANKIYAEYNGSPMNPFPKLTNEQIDAIFDYVDAWEPPVATVTEGGGAAAEEEESGNMWIWLVIAGLAIVVIIYVGSVKRQLKDAIAEKDGEADQIPQTLSDRVRDWAWKNRVFVGIGGMVALICGLAALFIWGNETVGIYQGYKPSQPIEFSHKIHAGDQGIACQYCHNTVEKSRTASVPSVNLCMNCHKQIKKGTQTGTDQIAKIYEAAGFDPNTLKYGEPGEPLKWNKVHVLPDHVYFSHQQHVVVGGVDCAQCHGDMTKETVAKIQNIEDLNAIPENIKLHRPTLTMGWCIECHGEKGITTKGGTAYYEEIHNRLVQNRPDLLQKYLDDDKISVEELGGWECAKCHY